MKLIIDIPEAIYKMCKEWKEFNVSTRLEKIIANGTPLPEHEDGEKKGAENGNTEKNEGN